MYGYELTKARSQRRAELRRERAHLTERAHYYDLDDLAGAFHAQLDVSARVAAPLVALAHGLAALGFAPTASAQIVGVATARIEDALAAKLPLDARAAAALERQLEEEIPETAEPGRVKPAQI